MTDVEVSPPTAPTAAPPTPGSGTPRRRPKKMVSPRRARASKANLYSPELAAAKKSLPSFDDEAKKSLPSLNDQ
eukprot:CAMPEP_0113638222 /NCGR_PEP_ID=MMETSP0017_2-20120614/20013_1 /TAXON_ID=2856 /ORGANISM="Cylindrotheca closterium" /LENGTH=73 /DNA_ID=CAMNT_0000549299 /DNA_START=45 /DNA_END=266 /DNA_ORIENTATION=- /assembly_acc=CAM_ASM_000147